MAEREVFPFADDRMVIDAFLRNEHPMRSDYLDAGGGKLRFNSLHIAWFDTAGALVVSLPTGLEYLSSARVVAEIAKQVGTTVVITRQRLDEFVPDPTTGGSKLQVFQYFIDDQPYELGSPYVLVGSLGMQAWRGQ
jgi:hypothetical protein